MLKVKFFFLCFYCFCYSYGQSQQTKPLKLLYIVDSGNNYMIPYVEDILRRMTNYDGSSKIFETITNLNIFADNANLRAQLLDNYVANESEKSLQNQFNVGRQKNELLTAAIKSSDKVLKIKVNTFDGLIEYQFSLFDVNKKNITLVYDRSSSKFIDPRANTYKQQIEAALKAIFPSADYPPKVKISVNNNPYSCGQLTFTDKDTIRINVIVYDKDSPEDNLSYFWNQNDNSQIDDFEVSEKNQILYGVRPGHYSLSLTVDDGVAQTTTENITFTVIKQPTLTITQESLYNYKSRNTAINLIFQSSQLGRENDLLNSPELFFTHRGFENTCDTKELVVNLKLFDSKNHEVYNSSLPYYDSTLVSALPEPTGNLNYALSEQFQKFREFPSGDYFLSVSLRKNSVTSQTNIFRVNLYKRAPVSLRFEYIIHPLASYTSLNSWLNLGAGINWSLSRRFSLSSLGGFNLINHTANNLFGKLRLNIEVPEEDFRESYSLIGFKNSQTGKVNLAIGAEISFVQSQVTFANTDIGFSAFYNPNPDSYNRKWIFSLIVGSNFHFRKSDN